MSNRPYRILYVENANSVGGSIISIYRLVQRLDCQQYEPIILFHRPNDYEARFRGLGIEVVVLEDEAAHSTQGAVARPRDIAAWLGRYSSVLADTYRKLKTVYLLGSQTFPKTRQIGRVIDSFEIDLVHLNNRLVDNRSGALAAWLTHTPCICHARDFDRLTLFDRWLAPKVDYFAFMSRALEQGLRDVVPALRGSVVYDGLELGAFLNAQETTLLRQQWGLDESDFVVGNVGRLVPWKGQEVFLRALARVVPHVPNLKALIVGEPDPPTETAYLQQLLTLTQKLDLSDIVHFTGFQSDIPAVMASLDVLVHSSSSPEPFGIVVIEGMAAGKPVVATSAGGVLDIIEDGHSGLLVPPEDDRAMAEAIIELARDQDLAVRMGAEARQRIVTRFTAVQYAQAVQDIYQSMLVHDEADTESFSASGVKGLPG